MELKLRGDYAAIAEPKCNAVKARSKIGIRVPVYRVLVYRN